MKNQDLARKLARKTRQSPAQARDEIDELVHQILSALREGRPVELPGVGKLVSPKRRKARKSPRKRKAK